MQRQLARQVLGTAVLAAAVTLGVSAQPPSSRPAQATGGAGAPIRLRATTFVPTRGERPGIRAEMTVRDVAPGRRGYFLVQFDGPIEDAWKNALTAIGADVLDYIPEFALKVRMRPSEAAQAARLPHVAWVGDFHPAYKMLADTPAGAGMLAYTIRIERGADVVATIAEIAATGANIVHRDGLHLTVTANASQVEAVAHLIDVAEIDLFRLRRKHNEFGGGIMRAELAADAGYDGSTQTIAITDTGLGGGTPATAHRDVPANRITQVFNWPGASDFCFETVVPDGPIDVDTGHGTHVATSALGGGDANGVGRGTAPGSQLVFQAIEDFVLPSFFCQLLLGLTPGYYLTGIPADVSALFQQSYDAGARVHSNSWGAAANGAYTADAASTDAFVWTHQDLAITVSAGNSGVDANADGVVDGGSLNSPATAKNVITVGASEGDRGSAYECDPGLTDGACQARAGQNDVFTYGAAFGSAFTANPLKDDRSAGNAEQMAAFSSRGPTSDGRIKPDVVAPGTWILSGYSDQFQQYYDPSANPQTGLYQYDGWGDPLNDKYKYMGGTSMSAPLVAGGAAVIRDYYQKAHSHSASAALVKATLVNSAVDLADENNDGVNDNAYPIPNVHEGWGRVDLATATDGSRQFVDDSQGISTTGTSALSVSIDESRRPLRVTLAWTDAPSATTAAKHLVNDLDLEVTAPDGTVYLGNAFVDGWTVPGGVADRINNLENIYVAAPAPGNWTITVRAFNVPQGPQPFALVIGREASVVPPQLPRVSVVATDATATEAGASTATFTLTRSGDLTNELTVSYSISGSATSGVDYVALSGTTTFAAAAADASIVLTPIDDLIVETSESVVLTLAAGAGYELRAPSSATVNITSDDQPGDLVVSTVSGPSTAAAGASITVTDTTKNQGSWPAQSSETGFYLSTNTALDSGDHFLGSRSVPTLNAGAVDTVSTSLTLPATAAGTYYVIAKADWKTAVQETSESNNIRYSTALRIGPDLMVSSITGAATAAAGSTITVTDTTRNQGSGDAAEFRTAFYLSLNTTVSVGDSRLGERVIPSLKAEQSSTANTTLTVPANTAPGMYYLIANADDGNAIAEPTESNNARVATAKVKVGPDLFVVSVGVPSIGGAGSPLAISDNIKNVGGSASNATEVVYYLSANTTLDAADREVARRTLPPLDANVTDAASVTGNIPADVEVGSYYVFAVVDVSQSVIEAIENNNSYRSASVRIGPDLTVSALTAPLSATRGATINVDDTAKNTGGGGANPSLTGFYLSLNTTLDATDVAVATRLVPELAAGGSHSARTPVTIPGNLAAGTYYLIANANNNAAIDETSSTNNIRRVTIKVNP